MKVIGKLIFTIEAEGTEKGGKRAEGDYGVELLGMTMPLKTGVILAKNAANTVVGLGGITTVKFLHVMAVFDDPTVANATIELIVSDGSGDKTITGKEFLLVDTDITSIKLTNNSNDTTGSSATVFIELAGD